jgi:carbon-monoxide dehydrogenase small subunit
MMLTARALLDKNPHPDDAEIRQAISGQICRCTGYATIVRSVQWAAAHPAGSGADHAPAADEVLDGTDTAVPDVAEETADTGTAHTDTEVKA